MRRLTVATLKYFTLAVAATAISGTTYGWAASDGEAVKAAEAAYIAAVDTLDPAKLEALWVHDDTVTDFEPGSKTIAAGWDAVKKNLEDFPSLFAELKDTIADGPYVLIKGDLARTMTTTSVTVKLKDGTVRNSQLIQTDIFENRSGVWLLVSHTASRVPK